MAFSSDEGSAGALVAGSQHDLLGGLTDDDHTQYFLLAGRSGGQTGIGGTAAGNNLTFNSTSNPTKGEVRLGGASGLLWNEVSNRAAIGGAINSTWRLNLVHDSSGGGLRIVASANTLSAWARWVGSADNRNTDIRQFDSAAAGTTYGLANAGLGTMTHDGGSGILIGTGTSLPLQFGTNSLVRVTITGAGVVTLADAVDIAVNATTGTKIGTATTQKLSVYNATPIAQGAAVADAAGGAVVDAEARTALNALLARIRAFGIIAT